MIRQKIFIFEFVSGGGFSRKEMPASLFSEGFGMLKCIVEDFHSLGFEVHTILDHRINFLASSLKISSYKTVTEKDDYIDIFKGTLEECDSAFLIAPEFSHILHNLTKIVKTQQKTLLSINLTGIEIGTSKLLNFDYFTKNRLKTPSTYLIPIKDDIWDNNFICTKFANFKSPIVIKPDDGVGAESIFYFETKTQFDTRFPSLKNHIDFKRKFILQKFVEGSDLSISLIGIPNLKDRLINGAQILSVNAQNINLKNLNQNSEYLGGHTPVKNYEEIIEKLTILLENCDFTDFSGYFGIDFILDKGGAIHFIELNPRLTTSYIGLRNVVDYNIAKLILDSKAGRKSFNRINIKRFSIYTRINLLYSGDLSNKEIQTEFAHKLTETIPEIVTPPISFSTSKSNRNAIFSCFIATKTQDFRSSKKRLEEIIYILKSQGFDQLK